MHHLTKPRCRAPALALLAFSLASSVAAQDSAAPAAVEAVALQRASVGSGIGYGVDADRPRSQGQAQAESAAADKPRQHLGEAKEGTSWLPFTSRGYVGVGVGRSDFHSDCGAAGFPCRAARPSLHLYTGGMFGDVLGLEAGYRFLGRAERGGGRTEVQALGLSLVGRLPVGPLSLFAKAGVAYGRSQVSASTASLLATGSARGWGGTWGAGAAWELRPDSALVLEWASLELPMAGVGKQSIENTSIGFVHHF